MPAAYANPIDRFELSPEQLLSATVMSASKSPEKVMDAPAAIYVLSNEDIMRSGAASIPEALRMVPGVQVARMNASSWAISVRGFNGGLANKLLVLMDGREVYDPLFSGVYWDVQDTALEDIDRIEVIRGPGASLWGANAVNGVINIITKSAADTQGGMVSALAGNQERLVTTGRYGGTLGSSGHYRVYGKYLDRADEDTVAHRSANDGWTATRGGFRADWAGAEKKDAFTLQGDMYRSDASQFRFEPIFLAPFSRLRIEEVPAEGGNLLGRWTRDMADESKLTLQGYVDYTSRDQLLIEDKRLSLDLDGQMEFAPHGRHKVTAGGRYRLSDDRLDQPTLAATFTDDRRNDQVISTFVQDKITLDPRRWYLTLGSKFEVNDYTGFEFQPNARLQWHPSQEQMVWASVSRAVRTPSRLERDLTLTQVVVAGPTSLNTVGASGFDSEELIAYELGYRQQVTPAVSLDMAAFYNDYDHLSTLKFASLVIGPPHLLNYQYTNDTNADAYGFEATANWRALENLNFSASYSFLDLQLHGPASGALGAEGAELESPDMQANLRSQWDITPHLAFDTTLYYTSKLPAFDVLEYFRLDMRLSWKVNDGVQFDLVGQNLLDPVHREFVSPTDTHVIANEINRSLFGKVTWRF